MIQAMILAAGEGRRMRPLTLTRPKPLLKVGTKTLIEHQLDRLLAAGVEQCIINVAYLGEQIQQALGDGSRYGVRITYSEEPQPLETGGALNRALPLLDDAPFLLINADIWLDYPLRDLVSKADSVGDGHLVLVANPNHNSIGDFVLADDGQIELVQPGTPLPSYTFSGVSLLHPRVIRDYPQRREIFPLREVFVHSIARGGLSGELYRGTWLDIGTPERLRELEIHLQGMA